MATQQISGDEMRAEITAAARELIADGAALREVMAVLRDVCFWPKRLVIIRRGDEWQVCAAPPQKNVAKKQFSHASLAACVEFALKYEVPHD